jgi:RNA polymerase sigma factor (sigma-70 family)
VRDPIHDQTYTKRNAILRLRVTAPGATYPLRMPAVGFRSPLLRGASDEKLIGLTRRGRDDAYETLVERYRPRLLAFIQHMLRSREDAEDVLQEVYVAALRAMRTDDRPIHAKPWLYKIARNRALNHLRRRADVPVESMDAFERSAGQSAHDAVAGRERLSEIVGDVHSLPETQRTALILREFDALSYQQIAETMDTTVPAVKSLLVRARMGLAEAAEARSMPCSSAQAAARDDAADGDLRRIARRHAAGCELCAATGSG